MESLVTLDTRHTGEVLTLQRAAYVTEAQAHRDLDLPPLRQSLEDLTSELANPEVFALGLRDRALRLVAAVRVRVRAAAPRRDSARAALSTSWSWAGMIDGLLLG